MCGIVGYVTIEENFGEKRRRDFIKQALILDVLRGFDSTGVFGALFNNGDNNIAGFCKNTEDGLSFAHGKQFNKWLGDPEEQRFKYLVGHNRWATLGSVNLENAHPFREGPITLVHNGTLHHTNNLPLSMSLLEGVEVDSHVIAHNLACHPAEDIIPELSGSFALVWHDSRDDTLNMVKNAARPLHLLKANYENSIYFMSEAGMLAAVCDRLKIRCDEIVHPKDYQLLTWRPGELIPKIKEIKRNFTSPAVISYNRTVHHGQHVLSAKNNNKDLRRFDDRVRVGGALRDVPFGASELLKEEFGLLSSQRIGFFPEYCVLRSEETIGMVLGFSEDEELPVVIFGLDADFYREHGGDEWEVQPIGAVNILDEWYVAGRVTHVNSDYTPVEKEEIDANEDLTDKMKKAMQKGCIECGDAIPEKDADNCIWVNEYRDLLCRECTERWAHT
jgi:hypothetical protein